MKGQNPVIVVIIILGLILFVAYILTQQPSKQFKPDASITLSKYNIDVNNNESSELVTAIITRNDNENKTTDFSIKFFSKPEDSIYVTDIYGKRIIELPATKSLIGTGTQDNLQFKVIGTNRGFSEPKGKVEVELWWNNTKMDSKILELTIK